MDIPETIKQNARRLIEHEIDILHKILRCVESSEFVRAVELINTAYCEEGYVDDAAHTTATEGGGGRLVVVGFGKSEHVASKVADTFTSFGIHSFLLPATDVGRGELESISCGDVVLLFSSTSGQMELSLIDSLKIIGCKIILVTSKFTSPPAPLSNVVDITVCYDELPETDPHSLVPTCSAVAATAVGDAMAAAIYSLRGFPERDVGKQKQDAVLPLAKLTEHSQAHVLDHFHSLSSVGKLNLLQDIQEVDLARLSDLFKEAAIPKQFDVASLQPFPDVVKCDEVPPEESRVYLEKGLQMIANGEVATLVLAGGQATRTGITFPKGLLDVNLPSHRTLFEVQVGSSLKLQSLASQHFGKVVPQIPFYVMVNKTHHKTVHDFFQANNYFGLNPENLILFDQGTLPCLTFDGKLLLEEKSRIARAPDGHGGLYEAIHKNGIITNMKCKGIRNVFVYSVDNLLVKIAEPTFMGFCASRQCDFGYKVVNKLYATEPAGVVCWLDGKPDYVEYSELPPDIARLRDPKTGDLLYNAANILNLYYNISFLEEMAVNHSALKYHVARKTVHHVNTAGEIVIPDKPNAYKFEKIVLDCTPFAKNVQVFMVNRQSDFAPIKNGWADDVDSPKSARVMLSELHKSYITKNGGFVDGDASTVMCEIMSSVSYSGEGLEFVKGQNFSLPLLLVHPKFKLL